MAALALGRPGRLAVTCALVGAQVTEELQPLYNPNPNPNPNPNQPSQHATITSEQHIACLACPSPPLTALTTLHHPSPPLTIPDTRPRSSRRSRATNPDPDPNPNPNPNAALYDHELLHVRRA